MVTFDLGRVTTFGGDFEKVIHRDCGDVRSRTSYNGTVVAVVVVFEDCGDVRSRTSYNYLKS